MAGGGSQSVAHLGGSVPRAAATAGKVDFYDKVAAMLDGPGKDGAPVGQPARERVHRDDVVDRV